MKVKSNRRGLFIFTVSKHLEICFPGPPNSPAGAPLPFLNPLLLAPPPRASVRAPPVTVTNPRRLEKQLRVSEPCGRIWGRKSRADRRRTHRGECFVLLFKNSAKKFVLYGIMAVNILWEVSGNAHRATVILLRKSHFVAIFAANLGPCCGDSYYQISNMEFAKEMIHLRLCMCCLLNK